MRVLITGANGFLGSHVADRLASDGHELRLLLRRTSKTEFLEGLEYERADGDIRDARSLEAAAEGVEGVVHCAGLTSARTERRAGIITANGGRVRTAGISPSSTERSTRSRTGTR